MLEYKYSAGDTFYLTHGDKVVHELVEIKAVFYNPNCGICYIVEHENLKVWTLEEIVGEEGSFILLDILPNYPHDKEVYYYYESQISDGDREDVSNILFEPVFINRERKILKGIQKEIVNEIGLDNHID